MTIYLSEIRVGETYRFMGQFGRELKPRTVVSYDRNCGLPGGCVRCHTGITRGRNNAQVETMAGDYFARHALPIYVPVPPDESS